MLIICKRQRLEGGHIRLPSWVRAPLALNNTNRAYYVLDPNATAAGIQFVELLCSPFDTRHWADLWRIEIETEDRIGNCATLFSILQRNNVQVLLSEGSVNNNGRMHDMSLIVSCVNYKNEIDGKSDDRAIKAEAELVDLFDQISIEMIQTLNFSSDGSPKLKIRRLSFYHSLSNRSKGAETDIAEQQTITSGSLRISEDEASKIRALLKKRAQDDIWYTSAVDTKDRVIRVLFFGEAGEAGDSQAHPIGHLQILTPGDPLMLKNIFDLLAGRGEKDKEDAKVNIIRFQLRSGLNKCVARADGSLPSEPMRIDITFIPDRPWNSSTAMHDVLEKRIRELPNFTLRGGRVLARAGVQKNGSGTEQANPRDDAKASTRRGPRKGGK